MIGLLSPWWQGFVVGIMVALTPSLIMLACLALRFGKEARRDG